MRRGIKLMIRAENEPVIDSVDKYRVESSDEIIFSKY